MTVTGEGYVDCAKNAIYIISSHFQLFIVVDAIGQLVTFCGTIFIAGIPSLISYFILQGIDNEDPTTKDNFVVTGTVIVFFIGLLVSLLFMSIIS
jgi:hypothetical protein